MKRENGLKQPARFLKVGMLLAGMMASNSHAAITVTPEEMAQKSEWVNLLTASNLPPFSFMYDGQPFSTVLPSWGRAKTDTILDKRRTQHVIAWTNKVLQVRC